MKKFLIFGLAVALLSCKVVPVKRELRTVSEMSAINPTNKYLKIHMKDGQVYVLHHWLFDQGKNTIHGYGVLLDINRKVIDKREDGKAGHNERFKVDINTLALIETNDPGSAVSGGLTFVTAVSGAITLLCLTNPKACFGSCPTFYAFDGDTLSLQAEGFSTSVSPSMEKNDIDMLYRAKPSRDFELVVTNEALETHSIRHANLLVLPRPEGERVFCTTNSEFYSCSDFREPAGNDGFTLLTKQVDGKEYFSLTDEHDLNTREEIIISFPRNTRESKGLVIGKRQTLLTTFLMYQGLSYMGGSVGYWLSEVETGKIKPKQGVFGILGGIEIFVQEKSKWKKVDEVNETGPIAVDFSLIRLPEIESDSVRIKLRMTKGLWRIDYLAAVRVGERVNPIVVQPNAAATIRGTEKEPIKKLLDESRYLVTYPGEAFRISYTLPTAVCDVFLDSKGYYLEWIREQWMQEQNLRLLKRMISRPHAYLDRAAEQYKRIELYMEETFWKSRYVQK